MHRFSTILADPPWKFGDMLPGNGRGAEKHYPCMTVEQLCAMPLPALADDCLLGLWRVASMQQEALDVVKAWGFTVKSEIVWEKLTKHGKPHFGMGRYVRASHEVCLVCVRGKVKVRDRSIRSRFAAPVGRHSEKPEEIFRIFNRLHGGPYLEMFARRRRDGWTCIGNEVDSPRGPAVEVRPVSEHA